MSNPGDKLQGIFSLLSRESLAGNNSRAAAGGQSDSIARALSGAGEAFQLNQVTESGSGFSMFGGGIPGLDMGAITDLAKQSGLDTGEAGSLEDISDVLQNGNSDSNTDSNSGDSGASTTSNETSGTPSTTTSGDQLDPQTQADFDTITNGIHSSFQDELQSIQNDAPVGADERRSAVGAMKEWVRNNLPGTSLCYSIAHSALSDAEKKLELGWLNIQVLRMEFLLGWLHLGGLNQSPFPTWERSAPDNLDEFYTSNEVMGGGDGDWCTRFAGYGRKRTGFTPGLVTGRMFNSGYRVYNWAVHDRKYNHDSWPAALGISNPSNEGVEVIQRDAFNTLATTLGTSSDKGGDVDNFFATQGVTPQCGDILIQGKDNNQWKTDMHSHTMVVEDYDAATRCIYTVEGNYNYSRCGGRKIDLTDKTNTGKLLYLVRPGFQQHQGDRTPGAVLSRDQINEVHRGMANYVSELARVAVELQYLKLNSSDPGHTTARVYTWYTGSKS